MTAGCDISQAIARLANQQLERERVCVCVSGIHSTKPVLKTNAMSYCDTAGGFGEIR